MAVVRAIVVVFFLATGIFAQQAPPGIADKISLLTLPNASSPIDHDRLAYGFWLLVREQNLELNSIPRVIVIHVPKNVAAKFGSLSSSPVLVDHWQAARIAYYLVWVVGEPPLADYLVKLQIVLQHQLHLQQTDEEMQALVSRAAVLADDPCPPAAGRN